LQGYEPYGLHRAHSTAPKFDERFLGFGYDRVSWFWSLNHLGWSFVVLHSAFLMDISHPDSESRLQFVGDPMLRSCVEGLYWLFRREWLLGRKAASQESSVTGSLPAADFVAAVAVADANCLAHGSAWSKLDGATGEGWHVVGRKGLDLVRWAEPIDESRSDRSIELLLRNDLDCGEAMCGLCVKSMLKPPRAHAVLQFAVRFGAGFRFAGGGKLPGFQLSQELQCCFRWTKEARLMVEITEADSPIKRLTRFIPQVHETPLLDTQWISLNLDLECCLGGAEIVVHASADGKPIFSARLLGFRLTSDILIEAACLHVLRKSKEQPQIEPCSVLIRGMRLL
jgi:hypothetical protein